MQSASQSHDKIPWPIAIEAHTRIIHRTEPQMPDINKWNEVVKCWNSRVEPLNLWTVYWEQFNIMKLPIFSANEFLETAVRVAQYESVTNEEAFRKIFREVITLRQAELESLFNKAWNQVLSNTDAAPIRKGNRPQRKRKMKVHFQFDSDDKHKPKRQMSKSYTAESSRKLKRKRRGTKNTEERPAKRLKRQMSQSIHSQSNQGGL